MATQSLLLASRSEAAGLNIGWAVAFLATGVVCSFAASSLMYSGLLGRHMALHILLMNAVAPIVAVLVVKSARRPVARNGRWLALATFLQIAALWSWHAPPVLEAALTIPIMHVIMQLSLLAAAMLFWIAILSEEGAVRWRSILALLITSKLYCLLGALLIFAPEAVYPNIKSSHVHHVGSALFDQQLAGLLMLLACPPTYVLAGIIMAAQWLRDLASASGENLVPAAASSRQGS